MCLVVGIGCVHVSGARRSDLIICCCQKGLLRFSLQFSTCSYVVHSLFVVALVLIWSLSESAHTLQVSEMGSLALISLLSDKWTKLTSWWRLDLSALFAICIFCFTLWHLWKGLEVSGIRCVLLPQEFWLLHVAIKDILKLNCIPEHAQKEHLILVWAVGAFGNGLYRKCSLKGCHF